VTSFEDNHNGPHFFAESFCKIYVCSSKFDDTAASNYRIPEREQNMQVEKIRKQALNWFHM